MKLITCFALALSLCPLSAEHSLIPKPLSYDKGDDKSLTLKDLTIASAFKGKSSDLLKSSLTALYSVNAKIVALDSIKQPQKGLIRIAKVPVSKNLPNKESYSLIVHSTHIEIQSPSETGAFYATQTLLQLVERSGDTWVVPTCKIIDSPRFSWRGLMLDESRHFFGKKKVMQLLDTMAAHKMNRFHWHLTDNEGWRIEIKSYPKLTSVGAWHGEGTSLDTPERDQKVKGKNNPKYGGFYTQEDIKQIVAYAAERHIEIIPEIDVPGHGLAFCASYPEIQPKKDGDEGKDVQGLSGNVLSVVREKNYEMLDKIFGEIAALFPTKYIHVGGDEVNHNAWKNSPEHRAFMKEKGMKHVGALQNHFMLRLEKILKKHGKTLMGWNEIMHGGNLSKDTAVMAWISVNAGLHAARKGHPTIMAPGPHTYFDMKYPGHSETGHWWAGVVDTKNAYNWNPLFEDQLTPAQQTYIKGVHCCLWTEFVLKPENVDYKLWPRACATAEVGWTQQNQREWTDFSKRLGKHLDFLDRTNVKYRVQPPRGILSKGFVTIEPAHPDTKTIYTLDGSDPTLSSSVYSGQKFTTAELAKLRYRTLRPNGRMSKVEKGAIRLPIGSWKPADIKKDSLTDLSFPLAIDSNGLWFANIRRTNGKHNLHIESAQITLNGKPISTAQLSSSTLEKGKSMRMKFPVTSVRANGNYMLTLKVKGIDGNNTHGSVTFDKAIYAEPTLTAATKVPHYAHHKINNLEDYNERTLFWSSRSIKTGDTWTLTFKDPIKAKSITVPTGKQGTNDDILKSGILEYHNGSKWIKGAKFSLGPATLKFNKPTKVTALRIKATGDQESWLIIRDPQIKLAK